MGVFAGLLTVCIIGAIAGWLAGQIVKGGGFGLVGDILVGVAGSFLAGFLLPRIGLPTPGGLIGVILYATAGAVILLLLIRLIRRA